tara:strand:+ start:955 stop:1578 length:624 start_codon:yes stop_codon:yes gene_type:complete
MNNICENNKKNYFEKGTVMIQMADGPFSENEILEIEKICKEVDKEFVEVGDAGEMNHVHVGRFMTDVKKPEIVNEKFSNLLLSILQQKHILEYIKKSIGIDKNDDLYMRRVQFNQIDKDCFVGYHLDIDSNPAYLIACVLQLGSNFDGGTYKVYKTKDEIYNYNPNYGSLIISDCKLPHEVTKVEKGHRKSLVFFLSRENGLNKRNS